MNDTVSYMVNGLNVFLAFNLFIFFFFLKKLSEITATSETTSKF